MARRSVRDERQGDLFGGPPPAESRRTFPVRRTAQMDLPPEPATLAALGKRASRPDLDELVSEIGDCELAYLTIQGLKSLKRRLARSGRHRTNGGLAVRGGQLERVLREIANELAAYEDIDDVW